MESGSLKLESTKWNVNVFTSIGKANPGVYQAAEFQWERWSTETEASRGPDIAGP